MDAQACYCVLFFIEVYVTLTVYTGNSVANNASGIGVDPFSSGASRLRSAKMFCSLSLCCCSVLVVGNPWIAYLNAHHLPPFVFELVYTIPTVYFTSYVTAPLLGLLTARWLNSPRPVYRQPCRTVDEGFPCFVVRKSGAIVGPEGSPKAL